MKLFDKEKIIGTFKQYGPMVGSTLAVIGACVGKTVLENYVETYTIKTKFMNKMKLSLKTYDSVVEYLMNDSNMFGPSKVKVLKMVNPNAPIAYYASVHSILESNEFDGTKVSLIDELNKKFNTTEME